jgi:divalent metal cation (Fe/Co/Zn/Cd) transporter
MIETHGLLIGEAADPALVAAIREVVRTEPGVHHVNAVLTQHMGPSDILVNVSLDMDDSLKAGAIEAMVGRLEAKLKARSPEVTRVFIEIQAKEGAKAAAYPATAAAP